MRKFIQIAAFFCIILVSGSGCLKKVVEEQKQDLLKSVMTSGTWICTNMEEGTTNVTAEYAGWICQFNNDNTFTATKAGTVYSGTWSSDLSTFKFTVAFSGTVPAFMQRLNGIWNVVNSSLTVGDFSQTKNSTNYKMQLTKQ
jgi:hypothetical protein